MRSLTVHPRACTPPAAPQRPVPLPSRPARHPSRLPGPCRAARDDDEAIPDAPLQASLRLPLELPPLDAALAGPPPPAVLAPAERARLNSEDDALFFQQPRIGAEHADAAWRQRLTGAEQAAGLCLCGHAPSPFPTCSLFTSCLPQRSAPPAELYAQHLQPGWRVLDLCAADSSHLPPGLRLAAVQGLGMSAAELAANPQLTGWSVQDLNRQQRLGGVADASLDAVLCACGVQYLTQPEAVFAEVRRALRPGSLFILSFSGSCWEDKAIAGWLQRPSLRARAQLVQQLLAAAGFPPAQEVLWDPPAAGSNSSESSGGGRGDPFAALVAARPAAEVEQAAALTPPALREADAASGGGAVSPEALERWVVAYCQMAADARELGVPASAIPPLPPNPSAADVRAARDRLSGLLSSFLSAGL